MDRVKEIKRKQRIRNTKRKVVKAMMFVLVISAGMCGFDMVLAKFFYKDVSKETIVANTFYFSSDYLDEKDNEGVPPIFSMNGWDGLTTKNFAFVIRNYENPLLFNDSSQNVDYIINYKTNYPEEVEITLWKYMPDSIEAVNDYVKVPLGEVQTVEGGIAAYNHNDYKIMIESKNPNSPIEHDVEVEIDATTVNTQYIKQISAKVRVQYSKYTSYITSKGFKDVTKDSHALTYNICTANYQEENEMTNTDTLIATKVFCLNWDNENLQINRFDNRLIGDDYIYIGTANDESNNVYTLDYIEDNLDDFKNKAIINNLDGKNIGYLYYDTLPFSEFNIIFFKRSGVDDQVWDDIANMADVYVYNEN